MGGLKQIQIGGPLMIVIAGARAILGPDHIAGRRGECVPVAGTASPKSRPFYLIGGCGCAKQKSGGEVETGQCHGNPCLPFGPWPIGIDLMGAVRVMWIAR